MKKTLLVVRSGRRLIKPCGLICVAYPYARAILCPIASVTLLIALRFPPHLSSRLCCHCRCLNLTCLHASPLPQHLSHRHLSLPSDPRKINPAIQLISSSCARPYFGRLYILSEHIITLDGTFPAIQGWSHPACFCVLAPANLTLLTYRCAPRHHTMDTTTARA